MEQGRASDIESLKQTWHRQKDALDDTVFEQGQKLQKVE